jgi:hypothetical protein
MQERSALVYCQYKGGKQSRSIPRREGFRAREGNFTGYRRQISVSGKSGGLLPEVTRLAVEVHRISSFIASGGAFIPAHFYLLSPSS